MKLFGHRLENKINEITQLVLILTHGIYIIPLLMFLWKDLSWLLVFVGGACGLAAGILRGSAYRTILLELQILLPPVDVRFEFERTKNSKIYTTWCILSICIIGFFIPIVRAGQSDPWYAAGMYIVVMALAFVIVENAFILGLYLWLRLKGLQALADKYPLPQNA